MSGTIKTTKLEQFDCQSLTADDFSKFFADKIIDVRSSTCGAPAPVFTAAPPQCRLDCFSCVSESDVHEAIKSLPNKQCDLDPMPTWLLKANSSFIARFVTEPFNKSLSTGDVPLYLKSAYIIHRLRNQILMTMNLDSIDRYRTYLFWRNCSNDSLPSS